VTSNFGSHGTDRQSRSPLPAPRGNLFMLCEFLPIVVGQRVHPVPVWGKASYNRRTNSVEVVAGCFISNNLGVVDNFRTFEWPSVSDLEELVVGSRA